MFGLNGLQVKQKRNTSLPLIEKTREGYENDASFRSLSSVVTMIVKIITPIF